jgi:hypothetical protein
MSGSTEITPATSLVGRLVTVGPARWHLATTRFGWGGTNGSRSAQNGRLVFGADAALGVSRVATSATEAQDLADLAAGRTCASRSTVSVLTWLSATSAVVRGLGLAAAAETRICVSRQPLQACLCWYAVAIILHALRGVRATLGSFGVRWLTGCPCPPARRSLHSNRWRMARAEPWRHRPVWARTPIRRAYLKEGPESPASPWKSCDTATPSTARGGRRGPDAACYR